MSFYFPIMATCPWWSHRSHHAIQRTISKLQQAHRSPHTTPFHNQFSRDTLAKTPKDISPSPFPTHETIFPRFFCIFLPFLLLFLGSICLVALHTPQVTPPFSIFETRFLSNITLPSLFLQYLTPRYLLDLNHRALSLFYT